LLEAGLFPPGSIIGHELSGYIEETGKEVKDWTIGEAVVVMPLDPCGECGPCRRGSSQLCETILSRTYGLGLHPGGFAQYMVVRPSMLFKVPDGMDMKLAALTEPWAVAVHGVNLSHFSSGENALVMGAGPIGLLTAYALKSADGGNIYVTEPDPWRAQQAIRTGVTRVIDPGRVIAELDLEENNENRPPYVFDCAGTVSSLEDAVGIVRAGGCIVVLGIHLSGNVSFFPLTWFYKEISVSYSLGYHKKEFEESLNMLARGAVDAEVLISEIFSLHRISEAFHALTDSGHSKILIDCQDA
jgi:(R,R)-butanediol dehydrogenase/meso-butanediol dehydrogenase/diacetyl reductase